MILSPTSFGIIRDLTAAERIHVSTLANRGGTFVARTGEPVHLTTGYWISEPGAEAGLRGDLETRLATIEAYRVNLIRLHPFSHLGTWVDDDGRTWLDVSTWWNQLSEDAARAIGRSHGQRAIWDCANGCAVTC